MRHKGTVNEIPTPDDLEKLPCLASLALLEQALVVTVHALAADFPELRDPQFPKDGRGRGLPDILSFAAWSIAIEIRRLERKLAQLRKLYSRHPRALG